MNASSTAVTWARHEMQSDARTAPLLPAEGAGVGRARQPMLHATPLSAHTAPARSVQQAGLAGREEGVQLGPELLRHSHVTVPALAVQPHHLDVPALDCAASGGGGAGWARPAGRHGASALRQLDGLGRDPGQLALFYLAGLARCDSAELAMSRAVAAF